MVILNTYGGKPLMSDPGIKKLVEKMANVHFEEANSLPPGSVVIAQEYIYGTK